MEPATNRWTVQLPRSIRGYGRDTADRLLAELHGSIGETEGEVARLAEEVEHLEATRDRRAELERTLRDTMIRAAAETKRLQAAAARESAKVREFVHRAPAERRALLEREREGIRASLRELETRIRSTRIRLRIMLEQALDETSAPVEVSEAAAVELPARPAPLPEPAEIEHEPALPAPVRDDLLEPAGPRAVSSQGSRSRPRGRRRLLAAVAAAVVAVVTGALVAGFLARGADDPAPTGGMAGTATTVLGSGVSTPEVLPPPSATTGPEVTTPAAAASTVEEPAPAPAGTAPASTEPEPSAASTVPHRLAVAFAAAAGDCWLQVRRGSATGEVLFEGFLLRGESRRFTARKLWVRMGAPGNLTITVDGKRPAGVPPGTSDVLFTQDGVRVLGLG